MHFKAQRYILAIHHHQSISGAARELGISQSSLSRYLNRLETEIGSPLFLRKSGGLETTYIGTRYVQIAGQMLSLSRDLFDISPKYKQYFRVACIPFEGSYIHPLISRQFSEQFPDTLLMLIESADVASLLGSAEADAAITNFPLKIEGVTTKLLTHDEILLVTSRSHPATTHAVWKANCKKPWIDIEFIRGQPLIRLYPNQRIRMLSDGLLAEHGIELPVLMQTRSTLSAILAAAVGTGICFAPEAGMRHYKFPERPAFFSVGSPLMMDVYISFRNDLKNVETLVAFINLVRNFL